MLNPAEAHEAAPRPRTEVADPAPPAARALVDQALRVAKGTASERAAFHAGYVSVAGDPGIDGVEVVTELRRMVLLVEARLAAGKPVPDADELAEALNPFQGRLTVVARVRFHPHYGYSSVPSLDVRLGTGFSMQPALEVRAEPIGSGLDARDGGPIVGAVVEASFRACGGAERAIQTLVLHVNNVYLMVATVDLSRMP
jgi:hypothetical protein